MFGLANNTNKIINTNITNKINITIIINTTILSILFFTIHKTGRDIVIYISNIINIAVITLITMFL